MAKSQHKIREILFPLQGVVRRQGQENADRFEPPYPSPWAINCRHEDTIARRLRGGSRPGVTAYGDDLAGQTISNLLSVTLAAPAGVSSQLAVVSSAGVAIYGNGTYSVPTTELCTEDGEPLCTEDGEPLIADTGEVPQSCYLCARGRLVYAVASAGIVSLDLITGVVNSLVASSGKGTVPPGVTHGCVYRDRLVLAGANNAVYMSRQGDPADWRSGAVAGDSGRALVFQLSEAAEMGDVCTALMPFKDASLLAATRWGLWLIQGDPAASGSLRNISRGVGIVGPRAWCEVKDGLVGDKTVRYANVFLAETGLFMIDPSGDGLQPLSEDRLPLELVNIPDTTTVSLVYSSYNRGIYVFVTPATGTATHFFFDLVNGAFWPMVLQEDHQPTAVCRHDGEVLLAGLDGKLRTIGGTDDDGTAIPSYILLGPLRLASPNTFGLVTSIHGMIGAGSGSVFWRIIPGRTAEESCDNGKAAIEAYLAGDVATAEGYSRAAGTWSAGRSMTRYPRVKAMWVCVLLWSTSQWAYEGITIESHEAGRWR